VRVFAEGLSFKPGLLRKKNIDEDHSKVRVAFVEKLNDNEQM